MPIAMKKQGGGGRYGVAQVRLTKTEVALQDVDTGDRFVFPLSKEPPAKNDKSNWAVLLRAGKAGRVAYPATSDREARGCTVYPGEFEYAMNAKADMLYGLRPARDPHRCRFVGFERKDPKMPPTWEMSKPFKAGDEPRREFGALFVTSDADSTPRLDVRLGFWPYRFFPDKDDAGQDVMNLSLLSNKAKSTALLGQYSLYEAAGIIGRDAAGNMAVLVTVPGNLENYLPAVERILLNRLDGQDFVLNFQQKVSDETGKRRINVIGLYPDIEAAAPKAKPRRKAK